MYGKHGTHMHNTYTNNIHVLNIILYLTNVNKDIWLIMYMTLLRRYTYVSSLLYLCKLTSVKILQTTQLHLMVLFFYTVASWQQLVYYGIQLFSKLHGLTNIIKIRNLPSRDAMIVMTYDML